MGDRQRQSQQPPQSQQLSPAMHQQLQQLHHQQQHGYGPSPGAPVPLSELPLTLPSLLLLLRDAEYLVTRYGSTAAACMRLDELERAHGELQAQVATLQQKLSMALDANGSATNSGPRPQLAPAPMLFDVDALLGFLQRHCACRGDLSLLQPVLGDFQRSLVLPPDARFPARELLVSVQEMVEYPPQQQHVHPQQQHQVFLHSNDSPHASPNVMPHDAARKKRHPDLTRLTPKDKASGSASPARSNSVSSSSSTPRLIAPASSAVDRRARQEETQAATAAAMLSALSRPTTSAPTPTPTTTAPSKATDRKKATTTNTTATAPSTRRSHDVSASATAAAAAHQQKKRAALRPQETTEPVGVDHASDEQPMDHSDDAVSTRKRSTSSASSPSSHEVVVKQNLSLPHDKRNIVELKQSSQLLTLEALDALNRLAPWDDVYKRRTTFSHVLDFTALSEPARKWLLSALRIQFVWRREFWERLHWLPMSEAVCSGAGWERYRQTRKRRANKAIAAWRKVYSDSLELMRQRALPEDVWCDVSLWYMPSTPLYWLPSTADLVAELAVVDAKHPVRCYFVKDLRKHPFYNDDDIQRKYPTQHALPTPSMLAVPADDKEARVNFTPE